MNMSSLCLFFFNDTATTEIYTLSLHDALPILGFHFALRSRRFSQRCPECRGSRRLPIGNDPYGIPGDDRERLPTGWRTGSRVRSEEHTSELQSRQYLVCRLLLEKKKSKQITFT